MKKLVLTVLALNLVWSATAFTSYESQVSGELYEDVGQVHPDPESMLCDAAKKSAQVKEQEEKLESATFEM